MDAEKEKARYRKLSSEYTFKRFSLGGSLISAPVLSLVRCLNVCTCFVLSGEISFYELSDLKGIVLRYKSNPKLPQITHLTDTKHCKTMFPSSRVKWSMASRSVLEGY